MSFKAPYPFNDLSATLVISTFVLQIFWFAPLQVLIQNFGEFSVRLFDVLLINSAISLALIVLIILLFRVFRVPALLAVLTFLSTVAFLESRFGMTIAGHQPFDGKPIHWEAFQWLAWIEVGTILVLAILFVAIRKQTNVLSTLSVFILFFLVAGLVYKAVMHPDALLPERQVVQSDSLYVDQFYRLSEERNVIHIVADQAQGAMLQDIFASDPEHYATVFDGFTFFTQAMGRYKGTYPSVVYYMTGEAPDPEHDLVLNQPFTRKYVEEMLRDKSIVTLLAEDGFRTFGFQFHPGIFCKGPYTACTGTHAEVFAGMGTNSFEKRVYLAALTALDLALFQMSPVILRERIYDDGRWLARNLVKTGVTHSGILDLLIRKVTLDDNPGTYNYIHHAGAHAPLLFDRHCQYIGPQEVNWKHQREQVTCTLLQLEKLILSLKKADAYDQTMIVIHGDHGTPWLPPSLNARVGKTVSVAQMGTASTLMLIKPPGSRGPLNFSDRAVTIGDIPATIADAFALDHNHKGVQMFRDEPAAERERHYYTYESASKAHRLQALPGMKRFRVRGNLFDETDWLLPSSKSLGYYPSQLRMDHLDFERYASGFSLLEQHDTPARWVDGKNARVFLSPPATGDFALVFESYVPSFNDGQWMEITVAGESIARLDSKDLEKERHTITIPDEVPLEDVIEIEFVMGKASQTGSDKRQLSVLFKYIGLVPSS